METLLFNKCLVKVIPENGYVETRFDDEAFVPSLPHFDMPSIYKANELGYEGNVKLMIVQHEILHTFLCESCGLEYSPTLWSVAHANQGPGCISQWAQYEEEALVLSFQKYLNTKEIEVPLEYYLEKNELKIKRLRDRSLKLIEDFEELCKI